MYSTSQTKNYIEASYIERANYFFMKPNTIREIGVILEKLLHMDWKTDLPGNREEFVISA